MKLRFIWIGKTRNESVKRIVEDYLDRIKKFGPVEVFEMKDRNEPGGIEREGADLLAKAEGSSFLVALDSNGSEMTSSELAGLLDRHRNSGTRDVSFVIGGPNGLSEDVKQRANLVLSLSRMTFTHELARMLVLEQVYRAFAILFNLPYSK